MITKNIILSLFYSKDLLIFERAKYVWDFYKTFFPSNITVYFITHSENKKLGELHISDNEITIGVGNQFLIPNNEGLASTGLWHKNQNARWIFLQNTLYDYLLRTHAEEEPFFLYQSTITNIIDFRALETLATQIPQTNCYAGHVCPVTWSGLGFYLRFISGSGTILSHDMIKTLRNSYNLNDINNFLPNDVWQGLKLTNTMRFSLSRFDFTLERNKDTLYNDLTRLIIEQLDFGHFHFRIKTSIGHNSNRADIDSNIMLEIIKSIISNDYQSENTLNCIKQIHNSLNEENVNGFCFPTSLNPIWKPFPISFIHNDTDYYHPRREGYL